MKPIQFAGMYIVCDQEKKPLKIDAELTYPQKMLLTGLLMELDGEKDGDAFDGISVTRNPVNKQIYGFTRNDWREVWFKALDLSGLSQFKIFYRESIKKRIGSISGVEIPDDKMNEAILDTIDNSTTQFRKMIIPRLPTVFVMTEKGISDLFDEIKAGSRIEEDQTS